MGDLGVPPEAGREPSFDMPDGGPAPSGGGGRSGGGPTASVSGAGPASYTARFRGEPSDEFDASERDLRRGGSKVMGLVLVALVVTALGAGTVYLFAAKPPWFAQLLGGLGGIVDAEDSAALMKLVDRGKALAALDTDSDLKDAVALFDKAHPEADDAPPFAPALGAAAETYAIWAEHLLDDAALLRRLAKDAAAKAATPAPAPATAATAAATPDAGKKAKKGAGTTAPATAAATAATAPPPVSIDPALADGLEKDGKDKLAKARDLAGDALKVDPKQTDALRAMALVHLKSGDVDKMKDELDKVFEIAPEDPGALAILGVSYLGDVEAADKAEKMLRKAIAGNKDLLRAHYYLARVYADAVRPDDARKELVKLLDMNASHERASRLLRVLDGDLAAFAAAVKAGTGAPAGPGKGEIAATGSPASATPTDTGAPGTAVAAATTAAPGSGGPGTGAGTAHDDGASDGASLAPGSVEAAVAKAAKLLEDGNTKAAEKLFKKALEASPNDLEALTGLAYCYLDAGSLSSAAAMFKRALAVNATHGESIIGYAKALQLSGDLAGAAREYNRYLELYPTGPLARGAKFQLEKLAPKLAPTPSVVGTSEPAPAPPAPTPPPESTPGG
ncbi:MAG TPA: tetratricopeptide repeat protein [Myxococcota bacterium]|nr:tetratricopeptide repeat protein [Myxococcota bacterium]